MADEEFPGVPTLGYLSPVYLGLLVVGGQILLPILIVVFLFAKDVLRHPSLTNFLFSWVLYSISYSMLKYSNAEETNDTQHPVCLAQSALIHSTPIMAGVAGLIVIIQVWATFVFPTHTALGINWSRSTLLTTILVIPYVVLILFTAVSAIVAYKHPETVTMVNGLYCTTSYPSFRYVTPAISAALLLLVLGFEVAIGIRYYHMWRQISDVFPLANRKASTSLVLRVTLFNAFSLVVFVASIFMATKGVQLNAFPYMINASVPLAAAVVFGTQKDLWIFFTCGTMGKRSQLSTSQSIPSAHPLEPLRHSELGEVSALSSSSVSFGPMQTSGVV
ncbi:hypothetical protein DL96DRAFT_60004 [Flagelloscypha sp. PMI_526]|nr:hypothetical protein DL96DRAFT_60004 [Flagelloscypha sp. PMI_526]